MLLPFGFVPNYGCREIKLLSVSLLLIYTNSQTILMMQNFGSKPKTICKTVMEVMMMMGFLYLMINAFID